MPNPFREEATNPFREKQTVLNPFRKKQPTGIKRVAQAYLQEAQPAFKLAVTHPETFRGAPVPPEEIERVTKAPWSELILSQYPGLRTKTIGQVAAGVGGGLLELGTKPSTYIGAGVAERAIPAIAGKVATIPGARRFIAKRLPTFGKGLLERTALLKKHPLEIARQRQLVAPVKPKLTFEQFRKQQLARPEVAERYAGRILKEKFPPETRPLLEEAGVIKAKEIEAARRGTMTFPQQRVAAEGLKKAINFDALQPGDVLNAETRRAAGLKIVDNAKAALAGTYPKEKVMDEIVKLNGLHSEAGRLLGSLRDPLFEGERETLISLASEVAKTQGQKEAVNKLLKNITQPRFWDKLIELKTSVVLTSPHTIERATTGNLIGRIFKMPERVMAGGVNRIEAFFRGVPRERYSREAIADIYGMVRAFPQAFKQGWQALIHEQYLSQSRAAEAMTRRGFAIAGKKGVLARIGLRGVTAVDEFNHTLSKQASLYAQGLRKALTEKAPNLISATVQNAKNPTAAMAAEATREALTETQRIALGRTGKLATKFINRTPLKLQQLFLRTPVNLWKWGFQRSPAGILSPKNWTDIIKGTPGVRADAIGRMAMGQVFNAYIAHQTWQGNITGGIDPDWKKRQAIKRATGKIPYAVKIGDTWYSYSSFQPAGMQMAMTANITEEFMRTGKEPTSTKLARPAIETFKAMKNLSFLMGIRDMVNAFEDPDRWGGRLINRVVTGFTPTGVRYAARLQEPYAKEPEGLKREFMAGIPGAIKKVPTRLDIWGKPIKYEGTRLQRGFFPTIISKERKDVLEQELLRLEIFPQKITRKYRTLPLSVEERNIVTGLEGGIARKMLDKLIRHSKYRTMSDADKEKEIRRVMQNIRTDIRQAFLKSKVKKDLRELKTKQEKIDYIRNLVKEGIVK